MLLLPINTPSLRPCSESRTLDQMRANVFPPSIKHPHKNSPTTPHTRQPHARDPLPPSLPPWLPPHHHPSGRQHSPVTGPLARCESRGPQPRARALPAARRSGPARLHRAPPPAVERAPQGRPAPCWPPPRGPSAAPRARPAPLRSPQASSGAPPELRLSKGRRSGCPHPGPASPDPGRWRGGEGGGGMRDGGCWERWACLGRVRSALASARRPGASERSCRGRARLTVHIVASQKGKGNAKNKIGGGAIKKE